MTITADAIIQTVEVAVLCAIFARMGGFSEAIDNLKERIQSIEEEVKKWKAL